MIADVYRIWGGGGPDRARGVMRRYGVAYVVSCGLNSDMQQALKSPGSFTTRLLRGPAPDWLEPVPLAGTPYRVWRVID